MTGAIIPTLMHSAVKLAWARVVLGWVTSWEVLVLHLSFCNFSSPLWIKSDYLALHSRHIRFEHANHDRCDHTSTNAPDPIRIPKLSVLGRE